jgi:hypothetical protein
LASLEVDPYLETSDVDRSNNHWAGHAMKKRFQLKAREKKPNLMKQLKEEAEAEAEAEEEE